MWMAMQGQKLDSPGCKPEPSTQGYSPWGSCRPRYQPTRQCVKKVVLIDENRTGDRLRC